MRVLTPVVPASVVVMAARIDSRLDGIAGGGAVNQSEQLMPTPWLDAAASPDTAATLQVAHRHSSHASR